MSAAQDSLRLWLRLFSTTTLVERELDRALKREFGSTLPRFDLLAQLERAPEGLRMGELSERILTTGGNVTWLVRALEADKLVTRRVSPTDKRAAVVRLTAAGKRHFAAMARAHERWIADIFAALPAADRRAMHARLGVVKDRIRSPRTTA
ncbi:MAG: MarR family transcriptional regulator [Gemmatimonadota bacterium]|nr:MarR family transcriptional regulator [Gemmatimonadota bacterium]MDQ8167010.1 MarR family transcriptional regulator [Gemmatimonadota bacterium]MDQ8172829.1 MarR family transcriptional regulator [Gemmatimonadota bacterium]